MSRIEFDLVDGIREGAEGEDGHKVHKHVVMRELNLGDVLDANVAAERVRTFHDDEGNPQAEIIVSPTLVAAETLRRQIAVLGDLPGPLSMNMLRMLSQRDMAKLQYHANTLEQVSLKAVEERGRAKASS